MTKYRIVKKYHKVCGDYFTIQRKFLFFWIPTIGEWYPSPEAAEGDLQRKKEEVMRSKGKPIVVKELEV